MIAEPVKAYQISFLKYRVSEVAVAIHWVKCQQCTNLCVCE